MDMARQHRQDRGAERDADDAERHLVQSVGELEQGQRSLRQRGGEEGVDELADLIDSGAEGRGQDQHAEPPDLGRQLRQPQAQLQPLATHRPPEIRSEEHTSELQSLMRHPYAVFCLKKKQSLKFMLGTATTTLEYVKLRPQYTHTPAL